MLVVKVVREGFVEVGDEEAVVGVDEAAGAANGGGDAVGGGRGGRDRGRRG